jgi:hypothetical protein
MAQRLDSDPAALVTMKAIRVAFGSNAIGQPFQLTVRLKA